MKCIEAESIHHVRLVRMNATVLLILFHSILGSLLIVKEPRLQPAANQRAAIVNINVVLSLMSSKSHD